MEEGDDDVEELLTTTSFSSRSVSMARLASILSRDDDVEYSRVKSSRDAGRSV